ncbi:MAG: TatD family hydrolase [Flavobacteriales bacterium]|nr:TatD family hydrolase [Flavobacteriales bacterium]MDG1779356.1 TatD family hydrolase [Flavobacteriales bacterium]MDG2246372.1 TatD family hydrolase [Flavobacteriales bacterium]
MFIIDTHTHLYLEQFDEDRAEVMARAEEADVKLMLLPNIDVESIPAVKKMMTEYPAHVKGMMGLHPCSVKPGFEKELDIIEAELRTGDYVAVGEMGLDLYWEKGFLDQQIEAFKQQVEWAKELSLPVVLHVRDAFDESLDLLDEINDDRLTGVFHCFTGGKKEIARINEYGNFYYGMGGVTTFKKAGLDQVIPLLPSDKIILETDSPYLAPTPFRGKRNESAYTKIVAQRVADVLEVSIDKVAEQTTVNAKRLFNLS